MQVTCDCDVGVCLIMARDRAWYVTAVAVCEQLLVPNGRYQVECGGGGGNNKMMMTMMLFIIIMIFDQISSTRAQYLASQGIMVIKTDGRGSARRGFAFESCIYGRLGQLEIEDQETGVILRVFPAQNCKHLSAGDGVR